MIPMDDKIYIELGKYVKYYKSCISIISTAIPIIKRYRRLLDHYCGSVEINEYYRKYGQMSACIRGILEKFKCKSASIINEFNISFDRFDKAINEFYKFGFIINKSEYEIIVKETISFIYYYTMTRMHSAIHMNEEDGKYTNIHFLYIPIAPMHFRKIFDSYGKPIVRDQFNGVKIVFDAEDECRLRGWQHVYGIKVSGCKQEGEDEDFKYEVRFCISDTETIGIENSKIYKIDAGDLLVRAETNTLIKQIYYIYMDVDSKYDPPVPHSFIHMDRRDTYFSIADTTYVIRKEKNLFIFTDDIAENKTLK